MDVEIDWCLAAAELEAALHAQRKYMVLQDTSAVLKLNSTLLVSASWSLVP